jgi:outer membrane protein assembly factor BamB
MTRTHGRFLLGLGTFALVLIGSQPAAPAPTTAPKDDWLLFRGNPAQTGLASSPLPDKLEILWKFATDDGIEGAPAIAKGVVYVGSTDEHLYALSLADGSLKWKYKAGPIKAPPSVRDGKVYVGDSDGVFHCVDAAKGTKIWTFETGAEIISGANFAGDLVLFGSWDESLYCLDKDGKERWKFKTQGPVNGSPAVVEGKTFVAGCDSQLHVLDAGQGKELAAVDLNGQAGATAAVVGERLYVGTMSNQFLAVDWKKGEVAWTAQPERAQQFYASAAVTDSLIVVGNRDKRVYALERETGKPQWTFVTGGRVDCSPVVVGKRVYVGSLDNHFYVLDLATGKQIQKLELDGPIPGSPAVAADRLVVGTGKGTVYCFGAKQ